LHSFQHELVVFGLIAHGSVFGEVVGQAHKQKQQNAAGGAKQKSHNRCKNISHGSL